MLSQELCFPRSRDAASSRPVLLLDRHIANIFPQKRILSRLNQAQVFLFLLLYILRPSHHNNYYIYLHHNNDHHIRVRNRCLAGVFILQAVSATIIFSTPAAATSALAPQTAASSSSLSFISTKTTESGPTGVGGSQSSAVRGVHGETRIGFSIIVGLVVVLAALAM